MTAGLPRLLIIGNSHIAAPRLAFVEQPERWPGWDIDFCGLLGGNIGRLTLRDGVLVPADKSVAAEMKFYNLVRQLDVSAYDAFAIVGGFGWAGTATLCAAHRSMDFPSAIAGGGDFQLVGRAFLRAALRDRLRHAAAFRLLRQLAALRRPVLMRPEPLPSADCATDSARFGIYADMVARGDAIFWRDRFLEVADAQARDIGTVLRWSELTSLEGVYTRPEMMRGALRLTPHRSTAQPVTDYAHGNACYGARVMDQILDALPTA